MQPADALWDIERRKSDAHRHYERSEPTKWVGLTPGHWVASSLRFSR